MEWKDVPQVAKDWAEELRERAAQIKIAAADTITLGHVGYYISTLTKKAAIFAPCGDPQELEWAKKAIAESGPVRQTDLNFAELKSPETRWVKVAYSPALRSVGEKLNFFPGQIVDGLPNFPNPAAATLTTGLLGAGLGYGAGRIAKKVLPKGYGDNLGRTGALVGGLVGAAPGAIWAANNLANGKGVLDKWPLDGHAGDNPVSEKNTWVEGNPVQPPTQQHNPIGDFLQEKVDEGDQYRVPAFKRMMHTFLMGKKSADLLYEILTCGEKKASDTMGWYADPKQQTPSDVNIDAVGRTLWETGASPQLAGNTMAALYAAQQLPDTRSRPGWVTGHQLGTLAQNVAGDYATGLGVGGVLNAVVGTPYSAKSFGSGAVVLGIIGSVVPKLFGR